MPISRFALAGILCALALPTFADGPAFNCARITSHVNQLVCASPELSALDRHLNVVFGNLRGQPGIDQKALADDEARWLREVRNRCGDADCLRRTYSARVSDLLGRSQQTASPAAYEETKPFPVGPSSMAQAQALIGRSCGPVPDVPNSAGFGSRPDYIPIIGRDVIVRPHTMHGDLFAFLIDTKDGGCRVGDVVALPSPKVAGAFLQCSVASTDGTVSTGFGVRKAGQNAPVAYWEIDSSEMKLIRQPIELLGWDNKLKCRQPEWGE
jgi:hypothetical protein